MKERILIIEDDLDILTYVTHGLQEYGYECTCCTDGQEARLLLQREVFDLVIVDRMLPHLDGIKLMEDTHLTNQKVPYFLMISALGEVDDRVAGLKLGADDYLPKPFVFLELLARVESLLRRNRMYEQQTLLKYNDLEMDLITREVKRLSQSIELQPQEFKLLAYFMRHANQVVSKNMLLQGVWSYNFDPHTNIVDVHVSKLRQNIDKDFDFQLIHTVRGSGYVFGDAPQ